MNTQDGILDLLEQSSVVVNASPGSGKTTMALKLAAHTQRRMLILSYNNALAKATLKRVQAEDLETIVGVYTVHGLLSKLTGEPCHDDHTLTTALTVTIPEEQAVWLRSMTYLVLDELQDFTPLLWTAFTFLYPHLRPDVKLLGVGDTQQMLYDFLQPPADSRFLTQLPQLIPGLSWQYATLNTTYRLTPTMCHLVNVLFNSNIQSVQPAPGAPIVCIIANLRVHAAKQVLETIRAIPEAELSHTAILLNSTNCRSLAVPIVNYLIRHHFKVNVTKSGSVAQKGLELKPGHIQVMTFHASKGCEFENIIVVNERTMEPVPSLFVALTRGRQTCTYLQECKGVDIVPDWNGEHVHVMIKDVPQLCPLPSKPDYYNLHSLFSYTSGSNPSTVSLVDDLHLDSDCAGYDDIVLDTVINLLLHENGSTYLSRQFNGLCPTLVPAFEAAMVQSDVVTACMLAAVSADVFLDRRESILDEKAGPITTKAVQIFNAWAPHIRRCIGTHRLVQYKRTFKKYGHIRVGVSFKLAAGSTVFTFESKYLAAAMCDFADTVVYCDINTGEMCRVQAPNVNVVLAQLNEQKQEKMSTPDFDEAYKITSI